MKVMKVDFLETMHWNFLKFLENVTIIHMHLPLKKVGKWMHGFQVMEKKQISLCILFPVVKRILPVVFWDNKENEW